MPAGSPVTTTSTHPTSRPHVIFVAAIGRTLELFLEPYVNSFLERDWVVTVASSTRPRFHERVQKRVSFARIPFSRDVRRMDRHILSTLCLRRLIRTVRPRLLHVHTPIAAALARIASAHCPHVRRLYYAHGFAFSYRERNIWWLVERCLRPLTDSLVVLNHEDQSSAVDRLGYPRGSVTRSPGIGFDIEKYEASTLAEVPPHEALSDLPAAAKIVAVVGRLEAVKRVELALLGFAAVKDPNVWLVFCGEGVEHTKLCRLAKCLGVHERVLFLGWLSDVRPILARASTLLFLSRQEGLPLSVLESAAAGLPIVAFRIKGVEDILNGSPGWLIPSAPSPSAVAGAIRQALGLSPPLRDLSGRVLRFTIEQSLRAHDEALRYVLDAGTPSVRPIPMEHAGDASGSSPEERGCDGAEPAKPAGGFSTSSMP
jgi:glycosyltransferase involved in cell wall biosynthesis